MSEPRAYSPLGEALIKHFEGLYLEAYQCQAGKWTIGWGCTRGVAEGMTITRAQAQQRLEAELRIHQARVNKLVTVPLTQDAFDALVSFDFNSGGLAGSTLLRKLNAGDEEGALAELAKWCRYTHPKTGEKLINRGLQRRRTAEANLWRGHYEDLPDDVRRAVPTAATRRPLGLADLPAVRAAEPPSDPMPQAVDPPAPPKGMAKSKTGQSAIAVVMASLTAFAVAVKALFETALQLAQSAAEFGIDHVIRAMAADPLVASMMGGSMLTAGLGAFIWRDRLKSMWNGD